MLAIPERNRAAGYPPEVVDYRHWNAHSVFFLDPAGNVVEYIARHDLKNADNARSAGPTSSTPARSGSSSTMSQPTAAAVKDVAAVTQYKEGDDQFVAMGDEYGLLLMMKRGRIIDFTSNADNGARVYRTGVTVRGPKATKHQFSSHPYELDRGRALQLRIEPSKGVFHPSSL